MTTRSTDQRFAARQLTSKAHPLYDNPALIARVAHIRELRFTPGTTVSAIDAAVRAIPGAAGEFTADEAVVIADTYASVRDDRAYAIAQAWYRTARVRTPAPFDPLLAAAAAAPELAATETLYRYLGHSKVRVWSVHVDGTGYVGYARYVLEDGNSVARDELTQSDGVWHSYLGAAVCALLTQRALHPDLPLLDLLTQGAPSR